MITTANIYIAISTRLIQPVHFFVPNSGSTWVLAIAPPALALAKLLGWWVRFGYLIEGRASSGLYYKLHGAHRPVNMKKRTIKRRKRVPAAPTQQVSTNHTRFLLHPAVNRPRTRTGRARRLLGRANMPFPSFDQPCSRY